MDRPVGKRAPCAPDFFGTIRPYRLCLSSVCVSCLLTGGRWSPSLANSLAMTARRHGMISLEERFTFVTATPLVGAVFVACPRRRGADGTGEQAFGAHVGRHV